MTRRRLSLGLLSMLLAACATTALPGPVATPVPPSGIRGTVVLGPTCPTGSSPGAHDPVPCLTPYSAQIVVLGSENEVVARVTSAADGTFRLDLPPGDYLLTPQSGDPLPFAQPLSVLVTAGQYAEVQINYDTGIR
ncbi:MAG TPA: carboxypeptidase-like regulatory domain-containing protein [Candidatus Limnocylindria bacterium]|nr:carboxypeptidase-like regulatory domain-containing protein [Candidatus Limnocylindria bacterium]